MNQEYIKSAYKLTILIILLLNACATAETQETNSTPMPTYTSIVTMSPTLKPTRTPLPSPTPNITATAQIQNWYSQIEDYYDKGYLDIKDWQLRRIDDFDADWAQIDWFNSWFLGESTSGNFVFSVHYKWSSDTKTPNPSGCGFIFGIHTASHYYAVFLTSSELKFFTVDLHPSSNMERLGLTRGTGKVQINEPTEADFTIIVNGQYSYVIVNDEMVGEYTLPKNMDSSGSIAGSVLSGTNKGYGTRCEMTEMRLWKPK